MYNGKLITHVAFWIGCGSFAAYTTFLQFLRYYRNADTPKISYIKLHHSTQEDVYPDITICFEGHYDPMSGHLNTRKRRGNVHNNDYLQKYHSLSKSQYNDLLIGNEKAWNEVPNATRVADINFDKASLTLDSMSYKMHLPVGDMHILRPNITKEQLIQKSFQIPGLICFTRSFGSYFEHNSIVRELFRNVKLEPKPMRAFAFVHYPGRMLRKVFRKNRRFGADFEVTLNMLKNGNGFQVKLSLMSVLKKRPDAVEPCDPTPTDDKRFWEELFSRIPCLPAYWKEFYDPKTATLKDCNNFTQFSELNKFTFADTKLQLEETESILASLPTPCNEMEISVTSGSNRNNPNKTGENTVDIAFAYNMKTYQEIRNERDFGMESLWSCIGGYIGLFVGCSLLSLLDDGYDLLLYFFKANVYPKKLARKECK